MKTRDRVHDHFSIVIPTWNNLAYLQNCIESIKTHSKFNHQIVVVINGSQDGTKEWLDIQPDIDYVMLSENLGVCYGMNIARSLIQTDYLFYLNDDMYLLPNWDEVLWKEIQVAETTHPWFMLSATTIDPRPNNHIAFIEGDFGNTLETFDKAGLLQQYQTFKKNDWSGSSWPPSIVPIKLWDLVGGYSPEYSPGYGSDPDFVRKLYGFGVRYFKGIGAARAYHFGSVSTKKVKIDNSKKIFTTKYGYSINVFMNKKLNWGQDWKGPITNKPFDFFDRLRNKFKLLSYLIK